MRIYFMGIGGLMMGQVALMARQMGDTVIGSDTIMYGPMREALKGAEIYDSYSAERLEKIAPDLVVIGNAIGRGNPELEWFWDKKPFKFCSMADFIHDRFLEKRKTFAVCGTHGKAKGDGTTLDTTSGDNDNAGCLSPRKQ